MLMLDMRQEMVSLSSMETRNWEITSQALFKDKLTISKASGLYISNTSKIHLLLAPVKMSKKHHN